MTTTRQKVIAGNWKMYKTIAEAVAFIKDLTPLVKDSPVSVYLAVRLLQLNLPLIKPMEPQ